MKRYKFEILVRGVDQSFADVLLDCFLGILSAFGVKVIVSGVAEESEVQNAQE